MKEQFFLYTFQICCTKQTVISSATAHSKTLYSNTCWARTRVISRNKCDTPDEGLPLSQNAGWHVLANKCSVMEWFCWLAYLVFKSPVLGPQKDRRPNWTGPKKDRTAVAVKALWWLVQFRLPGFWEIGKTGPRYNLMGHFGANSHTCRFAQKQGSKINDFSLKTTWFHNFICKNYRKMTPFLRKNEGYHICVILGV